MEGPYLGKVPHLWKPDSLEKQTVYMLWTLEEDSELSSDSHVAAHEICCGQMLNNIRIAWQQELSLAYDYCQERLERAYPCFLGARYHLQKTGIVKYEVSALAKYTQRSFQLKAVREVYAKKGIRKTMWELCSYVMDRASKLDCLKCGKPSKKHHYIHRGDFNVDRVVEDWRPVEQQVDIVMIPES